MKQIKETMSISDCIGETIDIVNSVLLISASIKEKAYLH